MERSGAERETTNNRMELEAVVRGLETLKMPSHVELFTDSVYVGKGIMEWMPKWKANGWRRKERNKLVPVANEELWRKLDALIARHEITYTRVAGHSGHEENDRVDQMAVAAYKKLR
jgi:ribonuclease HI